MRLPAFRTTLWPFAPWGRDRSVAEDADDLMRRLDRDAYAEAENRSAREDIGLLDSRTPGHWHRVAREIARRSGLQDQPRRDLAA